MILVVIVIALLVSAVLFAASAVIWTSGFIHAFTFEMGSLFLGGVILAYLFSRLEERRERRIETHQWESVMSGLYGRIRKSMIEVVLEARIATEIPLNVPPEGALASTTQIVQPILDYLQRMETSPEVSAALATRLSEREASMDATLTPVIQQALPRLVQFRRDELLISYLQELEAAWYAFSTDVQRSKALRQAMVSEYDDASEGEGSRPRHVVRLLDSSGVDILDLDLIKNYARLLMVCLSISKYLG